METEHEIEHYRSILCACVHWIHLALDRDILIVLHKRLVMLNAGNFSISWSTISLLRIVLAWGTRINQCVSSQTFVKKLGGRSDSVSPSDTADVSPSTCIRSVWCRVSELSVELLVDYGSADEDIPLYVGGWWNRWRWRPLCVLLRSLRWLIPT